MLDAGLAWRIDAHDAPEAARLVEGRPPAEARDLLGRVYNLCRSAQLAAFDLATGTEADMTGLWEEIRRDHLAQIFLAWPGALGQAPLFDRAWLTDDRGALRALFGPVGRAPRDDFETAGFLGSDDGIAPLLGLISELFPPGHACVPDLPLVDRASAFSREAVENSPAARRATHPAMDFIEAMHGRGPLWRAMGRVIDLAMILEGDRPRPVPMPAGHALVPATRGVYALRVKMEDGVLRGLDRITPTDHAIAPGGIVEQMLAHLPLTRARLVPLLVALIDPCRPLNVEAARHA